ncbi:hypothetical protein BBP40_002911 [Aspergillus hancockii]|nr:hypothetical protein BBP40_002911 [Aspergillus hancockii]
MFELHLTHSFMVFCLPEYSEDEFLLTQNAYGIFEETAETAETADEAETASHTHLHPTELNPSAR